MRMNVFPAGPEASGVAALLSANQCPSGRRRREGQEGRGGLSGLSSGQCVEDVLAFIPRLTLAKVEVQVEVQVVSGGFDASIAFVCDHIASQGGFVVFEAL